MNQLDDGGKVDQLAVGDETACVLRKDGSLKCFTFDEGPDGGSAPLAGAFRRVSVGWHGAIAALEQDGSVAYWGKVDASFPSGTFLEIATDGSVACGIRSDGSITCGGREGTMPESPLEGTYKQVVVVGTASVCGVTTDGELRCYVGYSWDEPPPLDELGPMAKVGIEGTGSVGGCGITADATLNCWGEVCSVPGTFAGVAISHLDTCALDTDGEIRCWDLNGGRGCDTPPVSQLRPRLRPLPPVGKFSQIATLFTQVCSVDAAGYQVQCW